LQHEAFHESQAGSKDAQLWLNLAVSSQGKMDEAYCEALAYIEGYGAKLETYMSELGLDALVYPTGTGFGSCAPSFASGAGLPIVRDSTPLLTSADLTQGHSPHRSDI